MMNGQANMKVKIDPAYFMIGNHELNLSQITMFGGKEDCGTLDDHPTSVAMLNYLTGCNVVTTTTDFPNSPALANIPEYPAELAKQLTIGNHTFYGIDAERMSAMITFTKMSYLTVHTAAEYMAPWVLAPEKFEDLGKVVDAAKTDGKISNDEKKQLIMAGFDFASTLSGPGKPNLSQIAATSRAGLGAVDKGIGEMVTDDALTGLKMSERSAAFATKFEFLGKALKGCDECIKSTDTLLEDFASRGVSNASALQKIEAYAKDAGEGAGSMLKTASAYLKATCQTMSALAVNNGCLDAEEILSHVNEMQKIIKRSDLPFNHNEYEKILRDVAIIPGSAELIKGVDNIDKVKGAYAVALHAKKMKKLTNKFPAQIELPKLEYTIGSETRSIQVDSLTSVTPSGQYPRIELFADEVKSGTPAVSSDQFSRMIEGLKVSCAKIPGCTDPSKLGGRLVVYDIENKFSDISEFALEVGSKIGREKCIAALAQDIYIVFAKPGGQNTVNLFKVPCESFPILGM